jgi:hypothetical protein
MKNACMDRIFRSCPSAAGIIIYAANGAKTKQAATILKITVL